MLKPDQIQNNITSVVETMQQSLSQPRTSVSDLTEVLEKPCKTGKKLEELCDKLKDAEFQKKMVPQHKQQYQSFLTYNHLKHFALVFNY